MKEDDAEREKRCTSAEKHKSMQDVEKKEKRKNLECQALEERRAKVRHKGVPEEDSPNEDDGDDDDEDSEGMVTHLDRVLQAYRKPSFLHHA